MNIMNANPTVAVNVAKETIVPTTKGGKKKGEKKQSHKASKKEVKE